MNDARYPGNHCNDVKSLVIGDDSIVSLATAVTGGAILIRWASGARNRPFEDDNPFIDGFLEWMDAPEGQQSIEALDLVFAALEHAGVDARQRKIVWADGKRLSIEQSAERIHAEHPGVASRPDRNSRRWVGWKAVRRNPAPNASSRNSTGSSNRGSTTMSARHGPPESSRELGTLVVPLHSDYDSLAVSG